MGTLRYRWQWTCIAALALLSACSSGNNDPPDPQPPANAPPVANAGADQVVASGATVSLSGAGSSDANGSIASYAWTQTSGTTIALSSASTATPSFTAPVASGALAFQLTVTDNGGASHSDTVTVTVNAPPVANAGADQTVQAGAAVSLNGEATDSDGTIAGYTWTQTAGDAITLNGADTATPSFIAPAAASGLTFQFTVSDNHGASHSDSVTVTVAAVQPPPPPPSGKPAIGRQPTNPKAFEYGSALIFVAASGQDLTYDWYSTGFGTLIKSGSEPWLLRSGLDMSDDGRCYHVVISNSSGTVTSEPGCITVFEVEGVLDPFKDEDDGMGADDQGYASAFGNTLINVAELAAGALTGPSIEYLGLSGTLTGVPRTVEASFNCYTGSYVGATLDAVAVTAAAYLPTGTHSLTNVWDECRENSDDEVPDDGAIRIDYDFPERHGEGSFTLYLSGYEYDHALLNGIVHATVTTHEAGTTDRWDEIEIVVGEDFSSPALRVTSPLPQTISIKREHNDDRTRMDETRVDFDVIMTAFDSGGGAGTIFQSSGGVTRLRWVDTGGDTGEPTHVSSDKFSVGLTGGFHLATLQAGYGQLGWGFNVLPPEECPEGYICVDPPDPP